MTSAMEREFEKLMCETPRFRHVLPIKRDRVGEDEYVLDERFHQLHVAPL
jgi:hypothetical protein